MSPIFIPPPIRRTKKCMRCGQLYPKKAEQCIHCSHLNDQELEELKQQIEKTHQSNKQLGKLFLYLSAIVLIGMAIALLN